jgi:hypothetical protein
MPSTVINPLQALTTLILISQKVNDICILKKGTQTWWHLPVIPALGG